MRVTIVRATVVAGEHVPVGRVMDLPPDVARMLVALAKAAPVDGDALPPASPLTVQSQPAPVRRRR